VNNFSVIGYTTVFKIRPIKKAGFLNPAKPVYFPGLKTPGQAVFWLLDCFFVDLFQKPCHIFM
jgi:hypothetical protein